MTAATLIQSLTEKRSDIWSMCWTAGVRSSSASDYDLSANVEPWSEVTRLIGAPGDFQAVADQLLKDQPNEGFAGLETLWELTKDPRLWVLSDFHPNTSIDTDLFVVSYFYGGDTRRKTWLKYGSKDPKVMAGSIEAALNVFDGTARRLPDGVTVQFKGPHHEWEPASIVHGLLSSGWDVEFAQPQGKKWGHIIVHGYNPQAAVRRILSRAVNPLAAGPA